MGPSAMVRFPCYNLEGSWVQVAKTICLLVGIRILTSNPSDNAAPGHRALGYPLLYLLGKFLFPKCFTLCKSNV